MLDTVSLIALLSWLQIKHYVADYVLQSRWILDGKGDLRKPGGYAHAAIHAVGSFPVLFALALDLNVALLVTLAEFAVHYAIDHLKALHAHQFPAAMTTRAFWVAHGADQLLHQLTYAGIIMVMS